MLALTDDVSAEKLVETAPAKQVEPAVIPAKTEEVAPVKSEESTPAHSTSSLVKDVTIGAAAAGASLVAMEVGRMEEKPAQVTSLDSLPAGSIEAPKKPGEPFALALDEPKTPVVPTQLELDTDAPAKSKETPAVPAAIVRAKPVLAPPPAKKSASLAAVPSSISRKIEPLPPTIVSSQTVSASAPAVVDPDAPKTKTAVIAPPSRVASPSMNPTPNDPNVPAPRGTVAPPRRSSGTSLIEPGTTPGAVRPSPVIPVAAVPKPMMPPSPVVPVAAVPATPVTPSPVVPVKPTGTPPSPVIPLAIGAAAGAAVVAAAKPSPVTPVAVKPVSPGAVSPVKPVVPGAVSPVKPVSPAAVSPVKPGGTPPAPAGVSKSGTSVIKAAPPKETARITVKPSLPGTGAPKPAAIPTVKPAGAPVAAVAAGAAAGAVVAKATEAKPKAAGAPATTVSTKPITYEEPAGSTLVSTIAAGVCCVITWGTAAALAYFCFSS